MLNNYIKALTSPKNAVDPNSLPHFRIDSVDNRLVIVMLSLCLVLAAMSAQLINVQAYDYSTAKLCTTKYGAKSTAVKTISYALTFPLTITKKFTTTPTASITPPPQTTTSTTTTTVMSFLAARILFEDANYVRQPKSSSPRRQTPILILLIPHLL